MLVIVAWRLNKDLPFVAVHFVVFVVVPVARIHRTVVGIHRTRRPVVLSSCRPVVLSSCRPVARTRRSHTSHDSTFIKVPCENLSLSLAMGTMLSSGVKIFKGWPHREFLSLTNPSNDVTARLSLPSRRNDFSCHGTSSQISSYGTSITGTGYPRERVVPRSTRSCASRAKAINLEQETARRNVYCSISGVFGAPQ